jgi:hypothetical protein
MINATEAAHQTSGSKVGFPNLFLRLLYFLRLCEKSIIHIVLTQRRKAKPKPRKKKFQSRERNPGICSLKPRRIYLAAPMNTAELISEIVATYERHGWHLRRMLLKPQTRDQLAEAAHDLIEVAVRVSDFDALWFARASHASREAWELRLIAEHPYALFELFEANESEEEREQLLREMENRMREHVTKT